MTAQMVDERVFEGVDALLDDFVVITDEDTVVVTYTPDSREPAAWVALGLKHRGFTAAIVPMLPLQDESFAGRLAEALPDRSAVQGRLVIITLERDTMSHFEVLQPILRDYGPDKTMILRIISASADFFTKALNVSPLELSALNATLLHRVNSAKRVRVTTSGGTDITVELDSEKYQWISNRGVWRPGGFTILPAGEIATYPVTVEGVLVADGAYNANIISDLNAKLADNPVRVEIEAGKARDLTCANPELQEMFRLCLDSPNGRNVGEFGLGTNHGINEYITTNSHINERRCGLHLGFGQHNQSFSRVAYAAYAHLDLICDGGLMWIDDDVDPIDLSHVEPIDVPHPVDALDEDITGDCCGMGYRQLRGLSEDPTCAVPQ
ncbi:aminopeptidase [Actinokineospora inagensis]|uniref:aminopeptidase n=1 Tax=Actinokineospora inagensis TaxID=103730 RepID=UPI0004092436|nr:aminopeptidase [Actinokineospora inagensis]